MGRLTVAHRAWRGAPLIALAVGLPLIGACEPISQWHGVNATVGNFGSAVLATATASGEAGLINASPSATGVASRTTLTAQASVSAGNAGAHGRSAVIRIKKTAPSGGSLSVTSSPATLSANAQTVSVTTTTAASGDNIDVSVLIENAQPRDVLVVTNALLFGGSGGPPPPPPTPTPTHSGTPGPTPPPPPPPTPNPGGGPCGTVASTTYQHVIWIVMENHSYGSVIGNSSAPFTTQLAKECATAPHWSDAGSQYNSLPNYIALTTGIPTGDPRLSPFTCDCAPSASGVNVTVDNVFRQFRTAGLSEKTYSEGMSANCSTTGTTYAPKHNPALYMWGGNDRAECQTTDVPMGSDTSGNFINDLNNNTLPNFSFINPNMCNSTHDCGVSTGDAFDRTLITNITNSAVYKQGHTAVVLLWDEDTPIPNVVVSPSVHAGLVVGGAVSHYSLLRATEDMFGLPHLLAAGTAPDLRAATGL